MATARASDVPVMLVNGADSPRSRIGRGLESIGGLTAETLQRISTAVGGVVKSPVVLISKVGGLASPRAAPLPAPPESSLAERLLRLENQMKRLEEKFNPMIVVTELDLSTRSYKEKPQISKSLLQEIETGTTLENRVQMLEDRVNERMDRFEKALLSIQSRLDHVELSWRENVARVEHQESLLGEPQYFDAEQQSDNFETLEATEQNSYGALHVPGEAIGGSPTLKKIRVKEASSAAPTTTEHIEPPQEIDSGKNDDFLNPQEVSTPVYSKEAFLMQPLKSNAPSSEHAESVERDDVGTLPASSDQQLASTLEELHKSFVTQSSATTASAKFLEIAHAVTAEKSILLHATSEPQFTSLLEEPREACMQSPLVAERVAKSEEHVQEDIVDGSGTTIASAELPWPPTWEATQEDFTKEPMATAPNAKVAQELATQGFVIIALESSKSLETSKYVEKLSVDVPSANVEELTTPKSQTASKFVEDPLIATSMVDFEEFTQDADASKMMATTEPSLASSCEEPKEGFEKESMEFAPSSKLIEEHSDTATASSDIKEASAGVPNASFGEREYKVDVDESGTRGVGVESPLVSSFYNLHEDFEKEFSMGASSVKPAQELVKQEDSSRELEASKTTTKSKFVEDQSRVVTSAGCEEPICEDTCKDVAMSSAAESPLPTSHEDPQKDFKKESLVDAPSIGPIHEPSLQEDSVTTSDVKSPFSFEGPQGELEKESVAMELGTKLAQEESDVTPTSFEFKGASKFVEEPSLHELSASRGELAHEDGAIESDAVIANLKSPSVSSFEESREEFGKESMATRLGTETTQELATQEESDVAPTSFESKEASKFVDEPSSNILSASHKEPAHEDAIEKSITMTTVENPHEDFAKESPNVGLAHEISSQEDFDATVDMAFASSTPHLASKFIEKPSLATPNANYGESAHDEGTIKSETVNAGGDSLWTSSFDDPQEDFEKESLATTSSSEPTQGLTTNENSHMAPSSFESQEAFKFEEEPSGAIPSADCEEPIHEDVVDKSVVTTCAEVSPFAHSLEGPWEDSKKESIIAAVSAEPAQELAIQGNDIAPFEPQVALKSVEESSARNVPNAKIEELADMDTIDRSGSISAVGESPSMSSLEERREDYTKESLASRANVKVLEPTKEDESGKSPIALASLEAPSTSFSETPKEPLGISVQPEEPMQEKSRILLPGIESTLTSTVKESNHTSKEVGYKLAEDFKVHHAHVKSIEKEIPRSQSNLVHVDSDESLVAEDCDDHLESEQSGEEFFDAEHGSGNFEPWKSDEPKPFEKFDVGSDVRGEAMEINAATQKVTLAPASILKSIQEHEQALVREPVQDLEQDLESAKQAYAQEYKQKPVQEQEQYGSGVQPTQEQKHHPEEEPEQQPIQEYGEQAAHEHDQESGQQHKQATTQAPSQEYEQQPVEELGDKPEQQSELQLAQESKEDSLIRNNAMALPTLEPQVTSNSRESQEQRAKEPLADEPSTNFEKPPQMNVADKSGTRDLPLASRAEEPHIDTIVSSKKSLSSVSFHHSGNLELGENLEEKSSDTQDPSSTFEKALEREPLPAALTTEIAHGHNDGESDDIHISLEPQLEESKDALANELVKFASSSDSTELAQEVCDGESGAIPSPLEPQLKPTLEEHQDDFVKDPLGDIESASKSVDLGQSITDEPSLVTMSVVDKINAGIVDESPLTPIAEELEIGNVSSLRDGKHGLDEADQKFLEDVKIIAEPVEAISRTQSDLTHVKINREAIEDATKLQGQGSFLAFGSTSMDSKEALVKESLPSSKLLELFEEDSISRKKDPVLVDSSMTSAMEKPRKPLRVTKEAALASAKSVPKGHGRWRGFSRSSSEPQFAFKLEEHRIDREALAKESSAAAALPSASKLGEEHAQEDFGDTQCLPFKILGEGKPPRKESDLNLVEDVKSPATNSETTPSPYVLEPKPSKIKEKKKKEKKEKERKPIAATEEKGRRLSLGVGEMGRKSSLRAEEKDSKYSPRAEEKHKQPFKHLRDRLRHAFSANKEL